MSQETFLTDTDMADQLNVGESTLKLWRKRYTKWITGESQYPKAVFETLHLIADCTASGMNPSEIEEILTQNKENKDEKAISPVQKATIENENINTGSIDSILLMILEQQKIIASASERRAAAEERKAYALESRAEAEQLKANVFQGILSTLKDSSVQNTVSTLMDKIQRMNGPSPENFQAFPTDIDTSMPKGFEDLPELTETIDNSPDTETFTPTDTHDVSEPEPVADIIPKDDTVPGNTEPLAIAPATPIVEDPIEDMDDLSLLIDAPPEACLPEVDPVDMDDLSLLIDTATANTDEDIDDLSLLIDISESTPESPPDDMDDLSLLIDSPVDVDIDDLSLLLSEEPQGIDDLSELIDSPPAETTKKQEAPPENASDYKSQVLSRIIKMKEKEGLSVEETTKIFNDEGLKTLSGKGEWDTATITGIYKYIDSVREKGK